MRRKSGDPTQLVRFEAELLKTAIALYREGTTEFHGLALAKRMKEDGLQKSLVPFSTLYKALDRLESPLKCLQSSWEDPEQALLQGRPRRRLYQITPTGRVAYENYAAETKQSSAAKAVQVLRPADG